MIRDDERPIWCPDILAGWVTVGIYAVFLGGVAWLMW